MIEHICKQQIKLGVYIQNIQRAYTIQHLEKHSTNSLIKKWAEDLNKTYRWPGGTWLSWKRQQVTSYSKNVEKRGLLYTVGGIANLCSHAEKQYDVSSAN